MSQTDTLQVFNTLILQPKIIIINASSMGGYNVMRFFRGKSKLKSNSALAIAAGCTVVFMFIATIVSIVLYNKRMSEAEELLVESTYNQYDSYVVMIASDNDSDFWSQLYESAKAYGADHGVYVDLLSEGMNESYSKQEIIEMAIETDCDAIFVEGDDSIETADVLAKASKAGIPVFTLIDDVAVDNRVSYIGPNSYSMATLYANSLLDNIVKQKSVMILGGDTIDATYANNFVNNIQTALAGMEIPGGSLEFETKIVESHDAFATEEYIQNLFKENDLAPIVICLDEDSTSSFYKAMIDYNQVGSILLFGSSNTDSILTGIKQRVIKSTIYVDAASIGEAATEAFIEYRDTGYVSDYISVEAKIIDESNVDEMIKEVAND